MTTLETALSYLKQNISVIPLRHRGKEPCIKWEPFQDRLPTEDEVRDWFGNGEDRNLGIVTGELSGITVVDFDTDEAWQWAQEKNFPVTPLVKTGRGVHAYCKYKEGHRNFQKRAGIPGIDLRGEGGQVVAPPSTHSSGKTYEWIDGRGLDDVELAEVPDWILEVKPEKKTPFRMPETIHTNRNDTLFRLACSLIAKNLDPESVWKALSSENNKKCYVPLPERELQQLFKSAEKTHLRNLEKLTAGRREEFTDQANAQRLIQEHGGCIRYVPSYGKWVVFDGVRWIIHPPEQLLKFVRYTNEGLFNLAANLNDEERNRLLKGVMSNQSLPKGRAMIDMAATMPEIIIEPNQLDRDPHLLNVNNGTLNLRDGTLQPHNPLDLITKLAPVTFDPSAVCPVWEKFLERIMSRNVNLINFLQRAVGYSLTGETNEQCFFIAYGSGANGKSTLLNTLRALLGDYAKQAAPGLLMVKKNQGGANNDIARLPGARFVATNETEDGHRFDESGLKQMTGQDPITTRYLYHEYFEFIPQFKIWLSTNHKPVVKGDDCAIWRRIHLIPFNVTIPEDEMDRHLGEKLTDETSGILNWALDGCLEWQKNGLQFPEEVKAAVKEYRRDMDTFSQFLEECCCVSDHTRTPAAALYNSYKEWCVNNTGWPETQTKFGRILRDRGFTSERTPRAVWRGIGLLEDRF